MAQSSAMTVRMLTCIADRRAHWMFSYHTVDTKDVPTIFKNQARGHLEYDASESKTTAIDKIDTRLAMSSPNPGASERPPSQRSNRSRGSKNSRTSVLSEESTPLLSRQEDNEEPRAYNSLPNGAISPAATSLQSIQDHLDGTGKGQRRWATIISLSVLSVLVIAILGLGFAAPAIVEEYAKEALVVEPTSVSIDSFTSTGVRARIQGDVWLDASRVHKRAVRDLGRAGTWIARQIESGESEVKVYLPEHGNILLGTAQVPPIKMDIRDKHYNHIDFLTDLEPGDVDGIRRIAHEWLDGRLGSLTVKGVASLTLRSGLIKLGTQTITESMFFEGHDIPSLPSFDIEQLNFAEYGPPGKPAGMAAMALVLIKNDYPVKFDVPPLRFDVLVPDCSDDEYLQLGDAKTQITHVIPNEQVSVNVTGRIRQLPNSLTSACPGSSSSPLDRLLSRYLDGKDTTVFVRGGSKQDEQTPDWVISLIKDTTVPLPLPGHPFDNLIRNFSLANVHFSLPDPFADPNTPGSRPKISAVVKALVGLPKEMNFNLNVDRVRADADVYYHGKKLGKLDLHKWQQANTSRIDGGKAGPELLVEAVVNNAPLQITDDDVFTEVVQALVFGGKGAVLGIKAAVDVNTATALGDFIVREIPASGKVFVKPISGGALSGFKPQIGDLEILGSTKSSLKVQAKVNITNPTDYSAHVPYVNIHILNNDTVLGHATAKDVYVVPGNNTDMLVEAVWSPSDLSGEHGGKVGRMLLSQYISGFNTTLTLKTHESSIPSQPALGQALSSLNVTINTPKLFQPQQPDDGEDNDEDPDDTSPHFIKDATVLTALLALP